MIRRSAALAATVALVLVGCGGEDRTADAEKAVRDAYAAAANPGSPMESASCTSPGDGAYDCTAQVRDSRYEPSKRVVIAVPRVACADDGDTCELDVKAAKISGTGVLFFSEAAGPPTASLKVTHPKADGVTVSAATIKMRGTATPGATVTIEDDKFPAAADTGRWARTVRLEVGANDVDVSASADGMEDSDTMSLEITRRRTPAEQASYLAARAEKERRRKAAIEARVAQWKASARAIPYNQLAKNPEKYEGARVVYRGEIAEAQESDGTGIMRLNVTDSGYGIWSDDVWVDYEREIRSAADDIVTIYGVVTGAKSYDTTGGGTRTIPQIEMRYIEE